jgi:hypothetical protein
MRLPESVIFSDHMALLPEIQAMIVNRISGVQIPLVIPLVIPRGRSIRWGRTTEVDQPVVRL